MKTWLYNDLPLGAVVFKSTEQPATAKVGKIVKLDPAKNQVTVQWLFQPGFLYIKNGRTNKHGRADYDTVPVLHRLSSKGRPNINTLAILPDSVLDLLSVKADLADQARVENWTKQQLIDALNWAEGEYT